MKWEPETGWLTRHPVLKKVAEISKARQIEIYLVGGAVRDLLLKRKTIVDLDFAVPDNGLEIARYIANALGAAFYPLDEARGTGRVVYDLPDASGSQKSYLDLATFRGATLHDDLADRDFTINAMALNLAQPTTLIDPLGGRYDLASGQIKAVSDSTFDHDPVRILRAVRQAAEFGFTIEAQTHTWLSRATAHLARVSPERQRDELLKLLNTPTPGRAVQLLHQLGVLPHFLPEVEAMSGVTQSPPHHLDVFDHTTAALEAWATMRRDNFPQIGVDFNDEVRQYLNTPLAGEITPQQLIPLALLLHDSGKPPTRTQESDSARIRFLGHERESGKIARSVAQRLHCSKQAIGFAEKVVAHHMRPLLLAQQGRVSRRAIYRLFRDTTGGGYQAGVAVVLHALADHLATYPPDRGKAETQALLTVTDRLLTAYFEQRDQVVDPPPLLNGRDLIEELDLPPGHLIGLLLNRLREAQATGQVQTRAEALTFIEADPDFLQEKEGSE